MKLSLKSLSLIAILLYFSPLSVPYAEGARKHVQPSVLEKSEGTVGTPLGNYRLINQGGRHIPFNSLKGKPVLLSFMYIDCPDMCVLTNSALKNFLDTVDGGLKKKFTLLSISIDPENDTPGKLMKYGREYTDNFAQWQFATTDAETLSKIVGDLGFTYKKLEDGFDHLSRVTLIDSNGTIQRHFYGTELDNNEIKETIEKVLNGETFQSRLLTGTFNKILLFCSTYDPTTKTYKIDVPFVIAILLNYVLVMATVIFIFRDRIKGLISRLRR